VGPLTPCFAYCPRNLSDLACWDSATTFRTTLSTPRAPDSSLKFHAGNFFDQRGSSVPDIEGWGWEGILKIICWGKLEGPTRT